MLILRSLERLGSMHGYGIALHIEQRSDSVLAIEEGSLYPALKRMLIKGWVKARWGITETKRRARYYRLTSAGRRQLAEELSKFKRVMEAMTHVINPVVSNKPIDER